MIRRRLSAAALLLVPALLLSACNGSDETSSDNAKPADSGQGLQQSDVGSGDGPTSGAGSSNARQDAGPSGDEAAKTNPPAEPAPAN